MPSFHGYLLQVRTVFGTAGWYIALSQSLSRNGIFPRTLLQLPKVFAHLRHNANGLPTLSWTASANKKTVLETLPFSALRFSTGTTGTAGNHRCKFSTSSDFLSFDLNDLSK